VKRSKNRGRLVAGIAVTGAFLVPMAVFGAPALAGSSSAAHEYHSGSGQYQYRVTICHVTGSKKHPAHTIVVSSASLKAHLRHGDHLGACTGTETRKGHHGKGHDTEGNDASSGSTTTTSPGKSGETHGNGHHK